MVVISVCNNKKCKAEYENRYKDEAFEIAKKAVEAIDKCLEKIISKVNLKEYTIIVTADHGNCEQMIDLNTFMVTLQDYLLKISDVACVVMSNKIGTKWEKINNARDSRSRNSQTNTKRKDSKKKNKKR